MIALFFSVLLLGSFLWTRHRYPDREPFWAGFAIGLASAWVLSALLDLVLKHIGR